MIDRPFTREEAAAIASILRLAPHCNLCHVRPAARVWTTRSIHKPGHQRMVHFACAGCAHGRGDPLSWGEDVTALHARLVAEHPGIYNPEPHADHARAAKRILEAEFFRRQEADAPAPERT